MTDNTQDTTGGRTFRGKVVSVKMKDTVTVLVERYVKHPKYKKYLRRAKKILAHDPGNTRAEGEVVTIREVRPISKNKHFKVVSEGTASSA
jgi:small subunit ribosomal protein S17